MHPFRQRQMIVLMQIGILIKDKSDTSFYHSMIQYMDFEVGKILNKLQATGLDKNTIIIFSGDNGTPDEIHYNADSSE